MNIDVLGTEYKVTYLEEKDKQMLGNNADGSFYRKNQYSCVCLEKRGFLVR